MVNYRTYRITNKILSSDYIQFKLNGYVDFSGGSQDYIYCVNRSPFNNYNIGEEIEIDLDKTRNLGGSSDIGDVNIARPTYYSSSQQLTRRSESLGQAQVGRVIGNRRTGNYRQEDMTYNEHTGDYYYEYTEYTKK